MPGLGAPFRRSFLFFRGLGLVVLWLAACAATAAGKDDKPAPPLKDVLKELRKQSLVAMALPPAAGGTLRAEHRKLLDRLNDTLKKVPADDAGAKALVLFLRGQIQRHLKQYGPARSDYDACLAGSAALPADPEQRPAGLPCVTSLRLFRAFTFLADGEDAVLRELDAVTLDKTQEALHHEVGDLLVDWAEKLADAEKFKAAIRAYECVERFRLWEDDNDSPKRRIEMLRLQAKNRGQM